jgi:16S rRNA (cytosine967-C5)-methyltransferase
LNTRAVAAGVLRRIVEEGAYSNVVLPHATADLEQRDRSFVFRLVTDALRHSRRTTAIVEDAAGRKMAALDPEVRSVLQIAVSEMLTDDKGDTYATVNESVEATRSLGVPRAAPFVNAVLRSIARRSGEDDPGLDWATRLSVPDWVLEKLSRDHGEAEARSLLAGLRGRAPGTPIRVRPSGVAPRGARPVEDIAGAFYLDGTSQVVAGGELAVTDPASTAVVLALAPQPGERILDLAAAPGGKTMHLIDLAGAGSTVVALDRHRRRLDSARRRLAATGVKPLWVCGDGRAAPLQTGSFDAVLVDAPCTGLGTLRRRPEIAMRLEVGAPATLAAVQRAMLAEAWRLTRPGGRIVYSVCTVFAEETTRIVDDYPAARPGGLPGRPWGSGLLLAPHLTGTDGMFISAISRSE